MKKDITSKPFFFGGLLTVLIVISISSISWIMFRRAEPLPETNIIAALPGPKVDKQADKVLRQMSDYLTGLEQFSYKSEAMQEAVGTNNKKMKTTYSAEVHVKRPNKLRADITSENKDAAVFYDGSMFSILGKNKNMYAQASAPPKLDDALDAARDRLQIEPPGADLLYSNPYEGLMQDITLGQYLDVQDVNGTACHHLSFKGKEVDWEIWIQKGSSPLPRKYLIISKEMAERPEFQVEFSDWKQGANTAFNDQMFTFTPPKDAEKITFMDAMELKEANQK